jgi:hypothetical protein
MSAEASVLFDAPGPKGRRRHLIIAVMGSLGILALLYLVIRRSQRKVSSPLLNGVPFSIR